MSPIYRLAGEDKNRNTMKSGSKKLFQACATCIAGMSGIADSRFVQVIALVGALRDNQHVYSGFFFPADRTQIFVTCFTHRDRILS
jgi:hypothetical protein